MSLHIPTCVFILVSAHITQFFCSLQFSQFGDLQIKYKSNAKNIGIFVNNLVVSEKEKKN